MGKRKGRRGWVKERKEKRNGRRWKDKCVFMLTKGKVKKKTR